MKYTKSKTIEETTYVCSNCGDMPEYCFDCERSLEDTEYYCDGSGEHICISCYKTKRKDKDGKRRI